MPLGECASGNHAARQTEKLNIRGVRPTNVDARPNGEIDPAFFPRISPARYTRRLCITMRGRALIGSSNGDRNHFRPSNPRFRNVKLLFSLSADTFLFFNTVRKLRIDPFDMREDCCERWRYNFLHAPRERRRIQSVRRLRAGFN